VSGNHHRKAAEENGLEARDLVPLLKSNTATVCRLRKKNKSKVYSYLSATLQLFCKAKAGVRDTR